MTGLVALTDELVCAAAAGEVRAREGLAAALLLQVRLMVAARLSAQPRQMEDVEDISQAVLVGLVGSLAGLTHRTVGGLKAFLSTIVSRRVADHLRARSSERAGLRPASLDSTVAQLSSAGPLWQFLSLSGTSPLSAADRAEQCSRVLAELGNLKVEHREVITYAFFDQLATTEIAELMNISRPAASMLLIRALNTLRRRLGVVAGPSEERSEDEHGSAR